MKLSNCTYLTFARSDPQSKSYYARELEPNKGESFLIATQFLEDFQIPWTPQLDIGDQGP